MNNNDEFLPEFCRLRTLFSVVVIAQLLVFLLVLAQPHGNRWWALSLYSLYIQWITLASCLLLCLLRRWLNRLDVLPAALLAGAVIVLVTLLVTEAAWRTMGRLDILSVEHLAFHGRAAAMAIIVVALLMHYFYLQRAWRRQLMAESQARVESLQSRIRPHFLFNSLNTIASMIRSKPERAEEAVEDLAELFRAGLRGGVGDNTMGQELQLARDYLRIEGLRLEERLRVAWQVDALPMDAVVPALTLQPLLENAVYHGIEPRVDGGDILVTGDRRGDRLRIAISNPLPGPDASGRQGGMGMAQDNVRQRLELAFPGSAWLHARNRDGRYTVTLVFPYRTANP